MTTLTTLSDRQYTYNNARQISQIVEPGRSRTFGYDNADQYLISAGADPTIKNQHGSSAKDLALRADYKAVLSAMEQLEKVNSS